MEVVVGVNVHDEPNLLFKIQRKIKVFESNDPLPNRGYCLVANASKYGAVFVGTPDGKLAVYRLNELIDKECEPCHLPVLLQEKPTHLAVNSSQELLAVTGGQFFVLFKVTDLLTQNVSPSISVQFDVSPSTYVTDVKWNPCIPDTIAYAFYDGSIILCQAGQVVKKLQTSARCICWSPKGKQLVVGNSDGTICQYKPDLKPMKSFPAPNLFNGAPVEVMVIHWISTYQFAVVYKNAADNSKPVVTIVNTPKSGQLSCQNCDDICYSMSSSRPWYYYLQGLPQWNMILCSSSNSMEIGTLGSTDGATWVQWCQPDEARPELPLTDKKQENYPVGISIDIAAIHQLPWGENEMLPFMPTLLVLSQTGLLTLFNIINLNNQATQICIPVIAVGAPFPAQSQPIAPAAATAPQHKPEPLPQPSQTTPAAAPGLSPSAPGTNNQPPGAVPGLQQQPLEQQQQQQQPQQQPQAQAAAPKPQEAPPLAFSSQASKPGPTKQKDHAEEFNAALKADQEATNKHKADQEFKNMLVREVNEFQVELYKFMGKTREAQIKFYHELNAIDTNAELQNLDAATLEKNCSVEELRSAVIALKLELVRACAVVAEARTHSEAKDLDQWSQADPLTTKRVASVKKLAYYVQSQLQQAHKALEDKWNQHAERDINSNKRGPRMIRPIIDDVYQTLVKHEKILSQREADLKVLKNMLNECDGSPVYKSTRILRSTPFKNKDPLSKLTKNIINMSIEPQNTENKSLLTPQKLDALRDMLSNHKTVKIKPVNVEMKDHMAAIRMRYEKSVKENSGATLFLNTEPVAISLEFNPEVKPVVPAPMPAVTPIVVTHGQPPNATVGFTIGPKEEPPSPQTQGPPEQTGPEQISQPITITSTPIAPENHNALEDLLQNTQVTVELKKDVNIMEENICSPANLNFSSVIEATPTSFTTKPMSALKDMLNNFVPQTVVPNNKSSETGEPDPNVKEEKMSHLFKMSTSTPKPTSQIPDVLGNSNIVTIKRVEPKAEPKPLLTQQTEESKENVATKSENVILSVPKVTKEDKKENEPKVFSIQNTNKPLCGSGAQPTSAFTSKAGDAQKSVESKSKLEATPNITQKPGTNVSSASLFATANTNIAAPKPKSIFGSTAVTTTTPVESFQSISVSKPEPPGTSIFGTALSSATIKTEPSSIFGSANSAPKTISGSIFSATSSTPSSVFLTSTTSIFGTATTTQSFGAATTPVSAAKPAEITSSSAALTQSSVFGSTAKSVFSSAVFASTTTSSTSESTTSKPSSVFGTTDLPLLTTTTSTANTQTAKTTQIISGLTATTSTTPTTSQSVLSTPANTTSSIFGSVTSTTQPSIFGGTPTSTTSVSGTTATTSASVIGSTTSTAKSTTTQASTTPLTSVFGSQTTTKAPSSGSSTTQATISEGTTSQTPIFGSTTSTPTSAFGTPATTQAPALSSTTTTPSSVFGSATTTQASVFGSTTTTAKSVFGNAVSKASAFGSPATTPTPAFGNTAPTQSSVFGTPTTTQASVFGSSGTNQTSVFGSPATTQASVFGSPATTQSVFGSPTTSQASVFGTATSQPSVFGSTATTQSVFGAPQTTQSSLFGSGQTTQSSVFGSPASTPSVFGQTNQASVFGTPSSPASVFGSAQTQVSVFGTPTQSTQASVFGTPTQTTQASVFGTPATTTQASVFGSSAQSVFGTPATTTQSGSLFGGGDSLFASVNISTTSASLSGGSIFGGGSTGTSGFGGNTNVFGGKTTFGQSNPTAEAIFGGGGGGFGQTSQANNFWGSNNNSSGGFGSPGFGQQATTQPSSVFGTGSFSAPSPPGGAFGSPAPSTGGFGSGFGSKAVFGQPSGFVSPTSTGFGAPAAFGGFNKSPGGFGTSASFGGSPAFGGSAFGSTSPGGVFGNNASSAGFGSPTQSNATFESLATQNTLTFGNLAQQTPQPAQPAPSFNTSPSFSGWRG